MLKSFQKNSTTVHWFLFFAFKTSWYIHVQYRAAAWAEITWKNKIFCGFETLVLLFTITSVIFCSMAVLECPSWGVDPIRSGTVPTHRSRHLSAYSLNREDRQGKLLIMGMWHREIKWLTHGKMGNLWQRRKWNSLLLSHETFFSFSKCSFIILNWGLCMCMGTLVC